MCRLRCLMISTTNTFPIHFQGFPLKSISIVNCNLNHDINTSVDLYWKMSFVTPSYFWCEILECRLWCKTERNRLRKGKQWRIDFLSSNTQWHHWMTSDLLPPANEVWGKVIFLHLSAILFTGEGGIPACLAGLRGGIPACLASLQAHTKGGSWGVWNGGGLQAHTGGNPSMHWGRHPPADGYCCGRYASYWNAFLFRFDI